MKVLVRRMEWVEVATFAAEHPEDMTPADSARLTKLCREHEEVVMKTGDGREVFRSKPRAEER